MYFFPLVRLFRAFTLFIHDTIKCLDETKISTFRGHFDGFSTIVSLLTSIMKSLLWQQSSNGISFPLVLTCGVEGYVLVLCSTSFIVDYGFTGMSYRLSRSLCHSRQSEEVGSRARQSGYERPTLLNKINHGKQCRNGHKVTLPSRLYKVSLCPSFNRSRHTYYIYTIEYQGTVNHEEEKKKPFCCR
jgi:hypothetical protein